MKLLHLFAGPYPTVQGTQALVGQTCRLLASAGHEVHLLCYAHSAWQAEKEEPFTLHRLPDLPRFECERSGPSWRKALLDLSLAGTCATISRRIEPDLIHAHHYEALVAAKLADPQKRRPIILHMHALLGPELPTYFPATYKQPTQVLGQAIDRFLPRLANGIAAVSPYIKDHLLEHGFRSHEVDLVRPPLDQLPVIAEQNGCHGSGIRAVYTGNLDHYQGLDLLLDGLSMLDQTVRSDLAVEIVTASDSAGFQDDINRRNLNDIVEIVPHKTPADAWLRLGSAHISLIPRPLPGGAPIKLVNSLALGLPTLIDHRLAEDLNHEKEVLVVDMQTPLAVAAALTSLVRDKRLRNRLRRGALLAAKRLHSPKNTLNALESLYSRVLATHGQ